MAFRRWLFGQHCLWPPIHSKFHEKGENPIHGKEPFWVCTYCTRVHKRYEIRGQVADDPTKVWAYEWATGRLWKLNGKESDKARLLAPGEVLK